MKQNYKTKRGMRLLITLMLMSTLLLGCSSTEVETETANAKPEVETPAEEPTEVEEEADTAEPEVEETTEPEAEKEVPINEEPVEYMEARTYTALTDYIHSLDVNQPEIIIYNYNELYMIHMKEGQHYELKTDDAIIFNMVDAEKATAKWNMQLGNSLLSTGDDLVALEADYSKFEENQEFFFEKTLDNGEKVRRTCYLTPPTEEAAEPTEETSISEEPVELIEITSYDTFSKYLSSLDPSQPEIIIYNGNELYMIHMKEGQHYQLKPGDVIIFNMVESEKNTVNWNMELGHDLFPGGDGCFALGADYSKFEEDQEFFFEKTLDNGEKVRRTCYFTPPAE